MLKVSRVRCCHAGVMLLPEMAMSMLETSLPLWLLQTLGARDWQLGLVFIPDSLGYFIGIGGRIDTKFLTSTFQSVERRVNCGRVL